MSRLGVLSLACCAVLVSCAPDTSNSTEADLEAAAGSVVVSDFSIEGDERVLVGAADGKLTVFHLAPVTTASTIATSQHAPPTATRTRDGKAFLLYEDGTLATVDMDRGVAESTRALEGVTQAKDLELGDGGTVWISAQAGKATKHDLATGAKLAEVDLSTTRSGQGTIVPESMLRVGDKLLVQIDRTSSARRADQGAVAVVSMETGAITKVIELHGADPNEDEPLSGLNPRFEMLHDTTRDLIYVSAIGNRPANTGLLARIDAETFEVRDVKRATSGFQGTIVGRAPFDDLFVIYHTSTPTTSSHLFYQHVATDGALDAEAPQTIVDAFDGMDALAINASGSLVAMANTCITGFCINGAGVAFVDARTRRVVTKLKSDKIGYEPVFVTFR